MAELKLKVGFATFPYNGTSSGTSMVYEITKWLLVSRKLLRDKYSDKVSEVLVEEFAATPTPLARNRALQWAQKHSIDLLFMVDSDMCPDVDEYTDPRAVPFVQAALEEIHKHYAQGPLIVGAPYCSGPPHEEVQIFCWDNKTNESHLGASYHLPHYSRREAAEMSGVHECACMGTGLIAIDMRVCDLLKPPYFTYSYTDETQTKLSATEDVVFTRNVAIACMAKLGYNPLRAAWSSWAGHFKTTLVGKPQRQTLHMVTETLREALKDDGAELITL